MGTTPSGQILGDTLGPRHTIAWLAAATGFCLFAVWLTSLSSQFGYDRDVADMPVLLLAASLVAMGFAFAALLPGMCQRSAQLATAHQRQLLAIVIGAGLIARLVMFASEPLLEDDYQRYLFDGAVTSAGLDPYTVSPLDAAKADPQTTIGAIAAQSGPVVGRINHRELTTIYPPVAQAAFAIAHTIKPWSLNAWRGVVLSFDILTLVLVIALLREAARSPLWAALYWLNPLVLKEAANSAHLEPLVVSLVLLSLWLAVKTRPQAAATALGLAVGAKLWPVLLLPIILRPFVGDTRRLTAALAIFAGLSCLWLWLIARTGLGEQSGLLAYAQNWQTNSALFPMLEMSLGKLLHTFSLTEPAATFAIKTSLAIGVAAFAVYQARPSADANDIVVRAGMVTAALLLLSPAQYPWYALWLAPFLCFWPSRGFLLLTALIQLYYASFFFVARETFDVARPILVAAIWLPVWTLLAIEHWRNGRQLFAASRVSEPS